MKWLKGFQADNKDIGKKMWAIIIVTSSTPSLDFAWLESCNWYSLLTDPKGIETKQRKAIQIVVTITSIQVLSFFEGPKMPS